MPNPTETPSTGDLRRRAYFKANLKVIAVLLIIWAFVSFGCGILLAPWLNQFNLPGTGYKLGFWFAQQGSIYVFVLLIFSYVLIMNRLDRRYGVEED
jgi:putative solute:sodium symporter small subunit